MNLVAHTHDALRTRAAKVENIEDFRRMAEQLETLRKTIGAVGLAAPQVGAAVRLFVTSRETFPVCFNPGWHQTASERTSRPESSLSLPGRSFFMPRRDFIHAEWFDQNGLFHQRDLSLNDARIFQHMCQYLDGMQIWGNR